MNDLKEAHFEFALRREGFAVERKSIPPHTVAAEHAHPFDVRALVVSGEIALTADGVEQVYREGDIFVMPAGHAHREAVGPAGVEYIVGRRAADAPAVPIEAFAAAHAADTDRARAS